jgi:nitrogen fixation/metabolism regulation signal transduction histidine kinase
MARIRSFRRQVFLAILAVAMVPTVLALGTGTILLREVGSSTGTLGPWDAVAASGRALIDAAREAAPDDPVVDEAARRHGDALSASVRQSRLYTAVTERIVALLPLAALLTALVLAALAAWTAGRLSHSFADPIRDLVGWTVRISRGEPLPAPGDTGGDTVEFEALRRALRTMATDLAAAREREVEGARLRAWTEMARRVAHELKNPLTPMRVSAGTLARSEDDATRQAAEVLLEEVARLDEMARTFSQFGRPPEGPAAPVDLEEILHALVERHDGNPVPVRLNVAGEVPLVVGHHDMLARALRNLVVNAQEAVEETGGQGVEVRLESTGAGARVRVLDDGPGIADELLDRIWLPDVTTRRKGTGLGLALVRQAVEAHGGRSWAENRPVRGAAFVVELPREGSPRPAAGSFGETG